MLSIRHSCETTEHPPKVVWKIASSVIQYSKVLGVVETYHCTIRTHYARSLCDSCGVYTVRIHDSRKGVVVGPLCNVCVANLCHTYDAAAPKAW